MTNLEIFKYQNFGIQVESREDGFWNLTEMCRTAGKQPNDFLKTKEGKAFAGALAIWLKKTVVRSEDIPSIENAEIVKTEDIPSSESPEITKTEDIPSSVIQVKGKDFPVSERGTWGHRLLALRMAMWLDPMFAIWVVSVSDRLLTQGYVSLAEEIQQLNQLTGLLYKDLAIVEYQRDKYKDELEYFYSKDDQSLFGYEDKDGED